MKKALFPVVALILSSIGASVVKAVPAPGPKRPGPSAVEAARLKKNPPPNYLSHYLPDDRYKIAGGVWKYVSTDLDTYYHVPSSPNMLRQPANRVIGFANARDAEEAGYVADPTDGTAAKVAPAEPSLKSDPSGFNDEENRYIAAVDQILIAHLKSARESNSRFRQFVNSLNGQPANSNGMAAGFRTYSLEGVARARLALQNLNKLRPPARFKKLHSLNNKIFGSLLKSAIMSDQAVASRDFSSAGEIYKEFEAFLLYSKQANKEMERLRRRK